MGDGSIGEEKSALEQWKKEAEDNIKALEDIKKIAALSNTLNDYEDFDVDNAWESFSAKIEDSESDESQTQTQPQIHEPLTSETSKLQKVDADTKKSTPVFSLRNLSKIAAILIIVLGSVFLFNSFFKPALNENRVESYSSATEILNVDLEDGSHITLDKAADLIVTSNRKVTLNGRAHFDIERDESQSFEIELPVGNIVVLGTEFTVDAYDNRTEVYVNEGSVRYELAGNTWTLVEGDLVKVVNNEAIVLKGRKENYNSWKNQTLKFRDNNMVEVVDALSRHFKKDIIIEDKKLFTNCNVYDTFKNSSLNEILNGLSKTHGLKFQIRDKKVFIVSAKC